MKKKLERVGMPYLAARATTLIIFLSSRTPGYTEAKKNHYMNTGEATSFV